MTPKSDSVTIKFNSIVLISIILLFLLLVFGVVRSCNNTNKALAENEKLNDTIIADSIQAALKDQLYKQQAEMQDGQIALKENQLQATGDSLDKANARITKLLKSHVPVVMNLSDTGLTVVPNKYINECEDCFYELQNSQVLSFKYKSEAETVKSEYKKRKEDDSLRINDLTSRNKMLVGSVLTSINDVNEEKKKNEPRRKGLISVSTLVINANLPNAIGGGIGYQDKYNRIFSFKYFASSYGGIKQAEVLIPLSFRKR